MNYQYSNANYATLAVFADFIFQDGNVANEWHKSELFTYKHMRSWSNYFIVLNLIIIQFCIKLVIRGFISSIILEETRKTIDLEHNLIKRRR